MATAASGWELELQRASNMAQDISYALADRNARKTGPSAGDISSRARMQLSTLDKSIDSLEKQFQQQEANPTAYKLTSRDIASRREALKKLQLERTRLKTAEKTLPSSTDREALLGAGDGRSYGRETELTRDMNTGDMLKVTDHEMKKQDDVLDKMTNNLDKLKTLGRAIGDEADLHNKLLDDLDGEVEKGITNLNRETRRVEHFTRDARTCWMYIAICVLLAVLLALILVRWA